MPLQNSQRVTEVGLRLIRRFILAIFLFIAGGCHTSTAAGFDFKAGFGYDFLSQEYFLDSVVRDSADAILTQWSLKTDYLDDLKGLVSATFSPSRDRRIAMTARYEQTREFFRLKLLNDFRLKTGKSRFDITGNLDWRNRHDGEPGFGDSYLFGYSRVKWTAPVSPSLRSVVQLQGEFVTFDSVSATSFNYRRGGVRIGLEKVFENFSSGDIRFTVLGRQVPDSSQLDYVSYGLEGSYFGFYDQGELDLYGRFGHKDYNYIGSRNDFYRLELNGRNKIHLGEKHFTSQEIEFELTDYDPVDPVNIDSYRLEITLLTGLESYDYTLGIGPEVEALHEDKDEFTVSEDYFEAGAKVAFDYIKLRRLFLSVESVLGFRDLKDNDELLTDYTYERLNLIADFKLFRRLTLNVLMSTEWEWHSIATNDTRIYLLSSSLICNF